MDLTCTTLSNMCANGRNEIVTSWVFGIIDTCIYTEALLAQIFAHYTSFFSPQHLEWGKKKNKNQKPLHFSCTSMVLSTPAASATTFSWVSIAPLGFPDK